MDAHSQVKPNLQFTVLIGERQQNLQPHTQPTCGYYFIDGHPSGYRANAKVMRATFETV